MLFSQRTGALHAACPSCKDESIVIWERGDGPTFNVGSQFLFFSAGDVLLEALCHNILYNIRQSWSNGCHCLCLFTCLFAIGPLLCSVLAMKKHPLSPRSLWVYARLSI